MASQKQIAANRENAQKSTGPKTPEGKAAVKLNGVKHGLNAGTLVLPGEDAADFDSLFDALAAEHAPATPTEEMLVRQMAMASWRLRRLYQIEAGYYTLRLEDLAEDAEEDYEKITDASRLAMVLRYGSHALDHLSRCEARLERSFFRALRELDRLRAARPAILQKQTQLPSRLVAPPIPQVQQKQPIPIDRHLGQPEHREPDNIALLP